MVILKKIWGKINTLQLGLKSISESVDTDSKDIDRIKKSFDLMSDRIGNLEYPIPDEILTIKFDELSLPWRIDGEGELVAIIDQNGHTVGSEIPLLKAEAIVSIMGIYIEA